MYSLPGSLEFACGSIQAPVSATRYQVGPAGSVIVTAFGERL